MKRSEQIIIVVICIVFLNAYIYALPYKFQNQKLFLLAPPVLDINILNEQVIEIPQRFALQYLFEFWKIKNVEEHVKEKYMIFLANKAAKNIQFILTSQDIGMAYSDIGTHSIHLSRQFFNLLQEEQLVIVYRMISQLETDGDQQRAETDTQQFVLNNISLLMQGISKYAGKIMLKIKASQNLHVQEKLEEQAKSISTLADREIQSMVDRAFTILLPDSIVIGEESFTREIVEKAKTTQFVWVVDPLDGTKDYAEGKNGYCFATLLMEFGDPLYSCIYAPEVNIDGKGYMYCEAFNNKPTAFLNGNPIQTNNGISSLREARVVMYESSKVPSPAYYKAVKKIAY